MNLIVSDFDGTFYDKNYLENIEFINSLDASYDFVIATGRNYSSLMKDLKIKCKYYICNDGGYILDEKLNIIYKNYIDEENIKIIYNRMLNLNYKEYFFDYIDYLDKKLNKNINKLALKIQDKNAENDLKFLLNNVNGTYGYLSDNWINILSISSKKEKAIEFILNIEKYDKVYVIGNKCNDFDMIKKYNGFLIHNTEVENFKTIKNFLELKKEL